VELHPGEAGAPERRLHVAADGVLERAGRGGELHLQAHGVAVHGEILDHPEGDEVPVQLRVHDLLQGFERGGVVERHGRPL
jgi:hypothetical protein